jgi:SAM-dependent methyltransferase
MSLDYPPHVLSNRDAWNRLSQYHYEPGRRAWERGVIDWGIWDVPESDIGALGPLEELRGKDAIELGCGTAYFSSWLARLGAKPVGIDISPVQLKAAREFQQTFGIEFPLIEGSAEAVPLPDAGFDLALSEYGASIWCDPFVWIPEAARLVRPGGRLVFLRTSTLVSLCMPEGEDARAATELQRSQRGMCLLEWADEMEFNLPHGELIDLLHRSGFQLERLIELYPPEGAGENRWNYVTLDWANRWPSEEIWTAKRLSC